MNDTINSKKNNRKNCRKEKVLDDNISENEVIEILDNSKKHIPIQMRRFTSNMLKSRLMEKEKWENESSAANVHIEHLQEEFKEKEYKIQDLEKIIKEKNDKIELLMKEINIEKNKNEMLIDKQKNLKNNINEISEIIKKIEID